MNKLIYFSALAFLVSCSGTTNNKAELDKLKAQRDQLNAKISQIERKIDPATDKNETNVSKVSVTEAEESVFNHYLQVQGTVDGDQNIAVSPEIPGIVTAVYVKEGTPVKKGEVMAELDTKVLRQSLQEIKTQLELANSIYEKQSTLWAKNIGSEVQYLQAKSNKESLEERMGTLREQLKQAKIFSPITGTVESVPLRVGQSVSPGNTNSTIRVINMSIAKITADVSEAYATRIHDGNSVLVNFPDVGKDIESKLSFIGRYIDPTNRTFRVECKISSGNIALRANMIAYIKIKDYTNDKAICVPVNLVQNDRDGKFLYLAKQNGKNWVAEKKTIKTGKDYDGIIEVSDGLAAGDKIISAGFQNLNPGENIVF